MPTLPAFCAGGWVWTPQLFTGVSLKCEEVMFKYSPLPRHPKSVEGDFYAEDGQCLACGVPHLVAPALLAWVDEERSHCFWKKQPQTPQGLEQAIKFWKSRNWDVIATTDKTPRSSSESVRPMVTIQSSLNFLDPSHSNQTRLISTF
jgi:hypothetical protein